MKKWHNTLIKTMMKTVAYVKSKKRGNVVAGSISLVALSEYHFGVAY